MRVARTVPIRANWLPRAILSGFIASMAMLFALFAGYGLALWSASTPSSPFPGWELLRGWSAGLTDNPLVEVAGPNLYVALALHLTVALTLAVTYGYFLEPRLSGPAWRRGVLFSLAPWALSLLVFLPIMGAGLLGLNLGAGPLPFVGNLALHMAYGATLGLFYGPFGDLAADREVPAGSDDLSMEASEQKAAMGMGGGLVLGVLVGVLGAAAAQASPNGLVLNMHPLLFLISTALMAAAFGGLFGSLVGLTGEHDGSAPDREARE